MLPEGSLKIKELPTMDEPFERDINLKILALFVVILGFRSIILFRLVFEF